MSNAGGTKSDMLVLDILQIIFPNGTNPTADPPDGLDAWKAIPNYASDVFAFCGHVVQITGLMGYFEPSKKARSKFGKNEIFRTVLTKKDRDECKKAAQAWRTNGKPCSIAQGLWQIIYEYRQYPLALQRYQTANRNRAGSARIPAPEWWGAIFKLLTIADEACDGIGHRHFGSLYNRLDDFKSFDERTKNSRFAEGITEIVNVGQSMGRSTLKNPKFRKARRSVATLTVAAAREVTCIQPKGRVTGVGCATRNLSRNLAMTGPVGSVRCSWHPLLAKPIIDKVERQSLNLLLIPAPFELNAKWFKPKDPIDPVSDWGSFRLEQAWLADKQAFQAHISDIMKRALQDVDRIHGVIFPEYALDFGTFIQLSLEFQKLTGQSIEFFIAGTSNNCENEHGNHVMTAVWENSPESSSEHPEKFPRIISQRKHHRWRLDRTQISTYGLGSSLTPMKNWWEDHSIEQREINFFQFREDAVFASLICEDLARNDPCHDIIRSVAPNLVFALLMDGAQIPSRWPARYAGSLADDPGCTVLTLTSYGLLDRSNDQRQKDKSSSVGLLRDSQGVTTEISLPKEHHAILLTLGSEEAKDLTIDSRETNNASKWFFVSQKPLKVPMTSKAEKPKAKTKKAS